MLRKERDDNDTKTITLESHANIPVMIDKWIASFNSSPSKTVSAETPNASVTEPKDTAPPGIRFCHEDANVRIGPQKNPKPKIGSTSKKRSPNGSEKSPGQMSPKPTLNKYNC